MCRNFWQNSAERIIRSPPRLNVLLGDYNIRGMIPWIFNNIVKDQAADRLNGKDYMFTVRNCYFTMVILEVKHYPG